MKPGAHTERRRACWTAGITTDADGLDTDELEARLRAWREERDGPKPRVVYTIPCGSNPTGTCSCAQRSARGLQLKVLQCHGTAGATLSLERRKHLVQLATEHDLIIIEV